MSSLLSAPASNAKLAKSQGYGFLPYGLSLAPYNLSGHNVCFQSTPDCREHCVAKSGLSSVFGSIMQARISKTQRLYSDRDGFLEELVNEIGKAHRKAESDGLQLAIRLNVFSDLDWRTKRHSDGWTVFDRIDELGVGVTVYDYTKVTRRAVRELETDCVTKWNIVYSRSERNERECLDYLNRGGKVSVVFDARKHELPDTWKGYPVVDGDVHDLHFLHPAGSVIGLAAKGTARGAAGGFVVEGGRE